MKHLLLEAYNKGVQEMLYVVPFVAKALEACAHKSSVRSELVLICCSAYLVFCVV